jgi:proteasome lid subunit RPN8/RPN11
MAIVIAKQHLVEIHHHGESTYPHECCGFLLGRAEENRRVVVQTRRAQNQRDDSPQNRYQISPQEYIRADRAAREAGMDIVGFYHSHPDHPARPSQFDLDNAWPELAYVIVGVNQGKASETTAWMLADDRSRFLPEEIVTPTASSAMKKTRQNHLEQNY